MIRRALVTGASRGIGKSIALAFAQAGYDVAISARTVHKGEPTREHSTSVHAVDRSPLPGSLEETADQVRVAGGRALMLAMDLTDLAGVERSTQQLLDEWGGVDVVVHNGRHIGPGLMDTILDTPVGEYRKFVEAHAVSPIRITQMVLPGMLQRGSGTFVTVSSSAATEWYPTNPPNQAGVGLGYRLGKAAGHTLVGSLLAEYAAAGIRAFNINPGFVLTERNEMAAAAQGFELSDAAPIGYIGAVVRWLVESPEADTLQRTDIEGQDLAIERALYPDWRRSPP